MPYELPRFNAAQRYVRMLLGVGALLAISGAVLLILTLRQVNISWLGGARTARAFGYLGVSLWTAAAGFLSTAILTFVRQRLRAAEIGGLAPPSPPSASSAPSARPAAEPGPSGQSSSPVAQWLAYLARLRLHVQSWDRRAELIARWPPPLIAMLFAALALAGVRALWRMPAEPAFDAVSLQLIGAVLIVLAFPLLVLERTYANTASELLPEAPQLDHLLRVPLTACIALAGACFLMSAGFLWAAQIERVVGILIGIVSLEILLRCAVIFFVPFAPIEQRLSLADSGFAGAVLRLRPPSLRTINIAVRRQLGIDLSRSWALAFIQRALLPVLVGIGLLGWAVTGVTSLGISERGIYERFGMPVAVFGPGIHVHLPWPLGTIRLVEIGVVHLLPIEFVLPGGEQAGKSSSVGAARAPAAEGIAPEGSDRLWTDDHPFEGSYIIASSEHGNQSFQLVNIDMAVIYRVGLTEQAARDAAYRVSNIDELIQAISGQLLVRYFSHNTLLDLLGRSRESFTHEFQSALQGQLDHFGTGVEAIGVSVEAIHPPPGAASSYHGVQAAEIRANTQISVRRGDATRSLMVAQQSATEDRNAAVASEAERVDQAQADSVLFTGDRQAYAQDGYPFLLERWLTNVTAALGQSRVVLLDYRLNSQSMPGLDLRGLGAAMRDMSTVYPNAQPAPGAPPAYASPGAPVNEDN
jgi:regulator of protease activity HflC (stomatin/prohibitin superfamily)